MEEKQKENKIIEFSNILSEKAKLTFDNLNFFKHFTELDKKVSEDEKEKAIKLLDTINNMKDDKTKAETLKNYIDSNDRKEIIQKIIYAAKYLCGSVAIIVVAVLLNQNNNNNNNRNL
ncbi:hypothetical protein ACQVSG_24030 [Bacillus cereus]|uniref:hypothetical protein n=1 Tax=Bacillus cereus group TaxID=86661 RepID=UPI0011AAB4F1|nr:hypothetical protein [Bacillus thuringiensis]HDR4727173.1 hypothetical protein [Bacillus cereus]HDX9563690.1 hypothetical protein [Bacillus thuringiensis]